MTPSRRVLLIDDEADIREVARASLEAIAGWDVSTAASARDGLATAESERPDAILLDVMMPEMDGVAAARQLRARERTRDIPVILMTAKVQAADRRNFADLGLAGLISKPFDAIALADQIRAILGWEP